MVVFHQIAAALYLAAGIGALLGVVLGQPRVERGAALGLVLGALSHAIGLSTLHRLPEISSPPSVTDLPMAASMMAGMGVLFLLALMWKLRIPALTAAVGPVAFLAAFVGAARISGGGAALAPSGSWPHVHVVLGSAGFALLGVAGVAGLFFLVEHSRIKQKRGVRRGLLPSLEALDQVNAVALAIGFPLLTLGLITGVLWLRAAHGVVWQGNNHEIWTLVAWGIYAGLVGARFIAHQGARQAAASAVASFAFLLFAVIGIGALA